MVKLVVSNAIQKENKMLIFFLSLLICIILHEFGHLIVALLCKCPVEIISIGFGKPFFSFEYKKIRINITPFLLGGYVKLTDELKTSNNPNGFSNLPYLKKVYIAIAGCATNILIGLITFLIGKLFHYNLLVYFGFLSFVLGVTNIIPFPCLDGSYPILVWLEKFYGKEKGYRLMELICKIGFKLLIILQIATIPFIFYLVDIGWFK